MIKSVEVTSQISDQESLSTHHLRQISEQQAFPEYQDFLGRVEVQLQLDGLTTEQIQAFYDSNTLGFTHAFVLYLNNRAFFNQTQLDIPAWVSREAKRSIAPAQSEPQATVEIKPIDIINQYLNPGVLLLAAGQIAEVNGNGNGHHNGNGAHHAEVASKPVEAKTEEVKPSAGKVEPKFSTDGSLRFSGSTLQLATR